MPADHATTHAGFPWAATVAVAFWGASFVAVRIALEAFDPVGLVAVRLALSAVGLYLLVRWAGGALLPRPEDRGRTILLGTILGAHLSLQAWGLKHTSAIHTGWIVGFQPIVIAIGAQLFLRHRLRAVGWLGVFLGTAGVLFLTLEELPDFSSARRGDLIQLVGCGTWAAYTLLGARPVASSGSLRVTALAMAWATLLCAVAAVPGGYVLRAPEADEILAVLFLAIACSGLAFFLWHRSLVSHGSHHTAATLYLEPFFTMAVAATVLGEDVTARAVGAGGIVLVGVWLLGRGATRRPR